MRGSERLWASNLYINTYFDYFYILKPNVISVSFALQQEYGLAEVAVKCLCELLENCAHFNFSVNIAQLLVVLIDVLKPPIRQLVLNSLRKVMKGDKKGEITLQARQLSSNF